MLAVDYRNAGEKKKGIGEYIAAELAEKGVKCDYDLGVSDFKIDVAVIDPRDPKNISLRLFATAKTRTVFRPCATAWQ